MESWWKKSNFIHRQCWFKKNPVGQGFVFVSSFLNLYFTWAQKGISVKAWPAYFWQNVSFIKAVLFCVSLFKYFVVIIFWGAQMPSEGVQVGRCVRVLFVHRAAFKCLLESTLTMIICINVLLLLLEDHIFIFLCVWRNPITMILGSFFILTTNHLTPFP